MKKYLVISRFRIVRHYEVSAKSAKEARALIQDALDNDDGVFLASKDVAEFGTTPKLKAIIADE